jgi:hypothetical protein
MSAKGFVAYFYFVGWDCLSLGAHVCTSLPNIELHLPFGFVRIGWMPRITGFYYGHRQRRTFGYDSAMPAKAYDLNTPEGRSNFEKATA